MDLSDSPPLRALYRRFPSLQPVLREVNGLLSRRPLPTFTGWQMTTYHQVPWVDGWDAFKSAAEEVRSFERSHDGAGQTVDALLWRHWNIAWSVNLVTTRRPSRRFVGVECGVGDGLTAHFAASQALDDHGEAVELHLYDAWTGMRDGLLTESESEMSGAYSTLSMERTRHNLSRFADHLDWHPGHLPQTLDTDAPTEVSWLHVDLNSAAATTEVLKFFWPRLADEAVIVFDDYGWTYFDDTRLAINEFLDDRQGALLPLPTGQAFYFC
jgi:hypothetical protein